jgi:Thioesterase superfamily
MRCMVCGGEMILAEVKPDDAGMVVGFKHETLQCSVCRDIERAFLFDDPSTRNATGRYAYKARMPFLPRTRFSPAQRCLLQRRRKRLVGGDQPLAFRSRIGRDDNINFLRKPLQRDLTAEARLLKLGRRLATGEVAIHCDGVDGPVANATSTYSIPPRRAA